MVLPRHSVPDDLKPEISKFVMSDEEKIHIRLAHLLMDGFRQGENRFP